MSNPKPTFRTCLVVVPYDMADLLIEKVGVALEHLKNGADDIRILQVVDKIETKVNYPEVHYQKIDVTSNGDTEPKHIYYPQVHHYHLDGSYCCMCSGSPCPDAKPEHIALHQVKGFDVP